MAINTTYTATPAAGTLGGMPVQRAQGKVVYGSDSITAADYTVIPVGFTPRNIRWLNLTDQVEIEFLEGMTAGNSFKTIANGTRTLETTNGGITICDADGTANAAGRSFKVLQNATLAAILASKTCLWYAES